jgi:hypothetical protein
MARRVTVVFRGLIPSSTIHRSAEPGNPIRIARRRGWRQPPPRRNGYGEPGRSGGGGTCSMETAVRAPRRTGRPKNAGLPQPLPRFPLAVLGKTSRALPGGWLEAGAPQRLAWPGVIEGREHAPDRPRPTCASSHRAGHRRDRRPPGSAELHEFRDIFDRKLVSVDNCGDGDVIQRDGTAVAGKESGVSGIASRGDADQ